jgi:hypothetical protein
VRDRDAEVKRAIVALVASDAPLGPDLRRLLAGELQRLYFPPKDAGRELQKMKAEASANWFAHLKEFLRTRDGTPVKDIEAMAAEALGIEVAALRQRVRRARKRVGTK